MMLRNARKSSHLLFDNCFAQKMEVAVISSKYQVASIKMKHGRRHGNNKVAIMIMM